ncbi:uncharacterized protein [Drosophila virilis]|uniref:Saposin B-type domain-containing protein n=1 Tax=Drosophila virilis TaxID=7244 RepID=B4LKL3_DROVI|nr:uncharacterized protein LOC6624833 isoform X1 [Drosophila virilis]EDW60734.2 uncharacterized protein Dvir_GJ21649 [Drosophila virilis]
MRSAGPSAFVAVILMHSFLVSATIPEEVAGIKCKLHPTNLCDTLRIQPDQLTCTTCNLLMLAYKKEFDSTTRADMIEKLLHTCYSLHSLSDTCANIVSNYFDDFYELAKQHLQSNDICQVVSMCANAESTPEALAPPAIKSDQFYCGQCKQLVQHLRESLLHNTTEAQFRQKLDGYCKKTRGFKNECLTVVDQFYHIIYSILKSKLDADSVCSFINVCHEHKKLQEETESLQLIDTNDELESSIEPQLPQCFACKSAFRIVKKLIRSNISNEKLKNAMNQACNKVGKLSNKCHGVIDRHGDQMARFARNPRVICALIGMCFPIGQQDIQLAPVELEVELLVGDANKSEQLQLTADIEDKQSINCQLCKKVFKTLHKMVEHHQDIKLAMDRVCHVLKEQNLMNECQNIIKQHADMIIDLIKKNVPRQQICRALNKCLIYETEDLFDIQEQLDDHYQLEIDDEQHDLFALEEPLTAVELISKGSPKCAVCKTAIKALQHMVHHHEDKGEITKALGHVCHRMGKLQHACESVVNNHGAQIVDLMTKHMSAELICKAIHVCHFSATEEDYVIDETVEEEEVIPSELEEPQLATNVGFKGSPKCALCRATMKALQHIIRKGGDSGSIEKALQKVCHTMGKLKGRCTKMVQKHGHKIVDLMTKKTAGHKICTLIGMCHKSVSVEDLEADNEEQIEYFENFDILDALLKEETDLSPLEVSKGSPKCAVCKTAIKALQHMVQHHEDKGEITKALGHVCHRMGKLQHACESVVNNHGAQIVDLMAKHMSAELICKAIHVCHLSTARDEDSEIAETMLEEQIDQSEALELVQLAEGPVCIFCELFISKFKTSVNSKEKQTHFIKEILTSCDQLPSMFRKECHDIAVRFGPLALDMLGSVSPQEACRLVHFCFSEEEYNAFVALVQAKLESSQLAQPEQGPICIICELLVTRFEKLLDTKAKRAHILHSFLVTCDYMPHFIRNPCHSLIYGYGAAALDLISKVKPEDVCNHLPRCSSQTIQDSNENIAQ